MGRSCGRVIVALPTGKRPAIRPLPALRLRKMCNWLVVGGGSGLLRVIHLGRRRSIGSSVGGGRFRTCGAGGTEGNAGSFEEVRWRSAAGKDPYEIVGELDDLPGDIERRAALAKLRGNGIEQHSELSGTHVLFNPLCVAVFETAELALAIGESNPVAGLVGEAHRSLHRAVSTAHNEDVLVGVVVCFDEPVVDVRKLLALDA